MLSTQLHRLKPAQIQELAGTMLEASIGHAGGGHWQETFRRAKQRKVGLMRRIYDLLQTATAEEIEGMTKALTGDE